MIADVLRGFDSTGVIVGDDKDFGYYKKAVNSLDFLDMKAAAKLVNSNSINRPAFAIGHNRAATVGKINSANAHPFHHGDIVGVHNGTLRRFSKLDKSRDFDTDSEALFYNISEHGAKESLSNVDGAYALIWYDDAEGTVNIIRNDERPLTFAKVKDEDTVLWASESGMLKWLTERNGIKVEKYFSPKENMHCKFHLNSKEVAQFEYNKLEVEDRYPAPVQQNWQGGYGGYQQGRQAVASNTPATSESTAIQNIKIDKEKPYDVWASEFEPYTTTADYGQVICYMTEAPFLEVRIRAVTRSMYKDYYDSRAFTIKVNEVHCPNGNFWEAYAIGNKYAPTSKVPVIAEKEEEFVGPTGEIIPKSEMDRLTKDGCMLCRNGISHVEYDYVDWISNQPVCPDCVARDPSYLEG